MHGGLLALDATVTRQQEADDITYNCFTTLLLMNFLQLLQITFLLLILNL